MQVPHKIDLYISPPRHQEFRYRRESKILGEQEWCRLVTIPSVRWWNGLDELDPARERARMDDELCLQQEMLSIRASAGPLTLLLLPLNPTEPLTQVPLTHMVMPSSPQLV